MEGNITFEPVRGYGSLDSFLTVLDCLKLLLAYWYLALDVMNQL